MAKEEDVYPTKDPNTELTLEPLDFSGGWFSDLTTLLEASTASGIEIGRDGYIPRVKFTGIKVGKPVERTKYVSPEEQRLKVEQAPYAGMSPEAAAEAKAKKVADQQAYDIANDIGGRVYRWRNIKGIRPDVDESYYDSLGILQYGTETPQFNSDTYRNVGAMGPGGQTIQYKGAGLTDENNYLVRRKYNLDDETDARNELFTMSPDAMLDVLTELQRVGGFYSANQTVSNVAKNRKGYDANDLQAFTQYLDYSNERQKTWQALLPEVATYTSTTKTGGAVARVDTTEDIIAVVNEAMLTITGEKLNKSQWVKIAAQVKADQRRSFYANESPTNLNVAARDIASKANPSKGASYGLGKAMSLAFSALGSQ